MDHKSDNSNPLYSLLLMLMISLVFMTSNLYAGEAEWDARHKAWLLELTYPDHIEDDFGKEISEEDKLLLDKFKPKVIVSPKGQLPVDFYDFYLPKTLLRDANRDGAIITESPTRSQLKRIERDRSYYLDYNGPIYPCEGNCKDYVATGYGRVYREKTSFSTKHGKRDLDIIILKYTFPFPFSGLPAGLGFIKETLMKIVTDPVRFHELDIHGAVQIILDQRSESPIALLLAQHNHFRTYLIGKDVQWPEDNHIPVCFAKRSNEPYPCHSGPSPRHHRTVGHPKHMAYVIDGSSSSLTAGKDIVYGRNSGGRQVEYRLKFLPDKDPLYVSWIPLGDRKKLLFFNTFYRNGPPGIDLNTLPGLKAYGDIMQFWYFRDDSHDDATLMKESLRSFSDVEVEKILNHNGQRLYRDMREMGMIDY